MDLGPHLLLATLEGAVAAAVLALTALGLSLVFGVMRVVNVAHGAFFMLGAVGAWVVADRMGGPPWLSFLLALLFVPCAVGLLAAAADWTILRRIGHDPERTIVATIGLLYILEQGTLMTFGPEARPVPAPFAHRIWFPWFGYSTYKLAVIAAALVLLGLVWVLMTRTRAGLLMRATEADRETAQAFGVPVAQVHAMTFGLGAALAAAAAVLIVPIQQAHYLMGGDPLLLSFIVVILGGLGSLRGTLLAAALIGLSDGIVSVMVEPTLAKILATLLVALVLAFRPQGLFGAARA